MLLSGSLVAGVPGPAAGAPGARVIAEATVGDRLVDLTIDSPALGRTATVRLLTPAGWDRRDRDDRWPVLYLLHGVSGSHADWTADSDVEDIDALRDVLVVMPDAGEGTYTNWWNRGRHGPPAWETFHLDELRTILEGRYGAGTARVVAGLSMGGYGALLYAARRPGMFRAAASYSGPVHLLHPESVSRWRAVFADPEYARYLDVWGDPDARRGNWARHDPYHLADRLRPTPIFLACGDGTPGPLDVTEPDEWDIDAETFDRALNESLLPRLRRAGVRVVTDFYPGTHVPAYWERELHRSLPLLLDAVHGRTIIQR